jgi:protein-tyrosine phosphatase
MTAPPGEPFDRHLLLETSYNLRDVGGYATVDGRRTRWRTLLRADSLHQLTPASQATLLDLGLRTVIDLRWPAELARWPNVFAGSPHVRYHHLPVFDESVPLEALPATAAEIYRLMVDARPAQLRAALAALAAAGGVPAVVHCAAGKDRTGVVVALALAAAGVPEATIVADYALSNDCLRRSGYYDAVRRQALARGQRWEEVEPALYCPPEAMAATLAYLRERFGGVDRYLLAIGLTPGELAALRDGLTEPAAGERAG